MAIALQEPDVTHAATNGQVQSLHLSFDCKLGDAHGHSVEENSSSHTSFVPGLLKQSLRVGADGSPSFATIDLGDELELDAQHDFSVEFLGSEQQLTQTNDL